MNRIPSVLTLALLLAIAGIAEAQTSYPMLMSIHPAAAHQGATTEHTIESRYDMFGTWKVLVSGEGVTGEAVLPEVKEGEKPPTLTKLKVKFTVAKDALPGVREVRLATPRGISTVGQLVVTREPVVVEQPKNDTLETAQDVTVPATICGVVERNEDVDFYRFTAEAGQSLAFHVRSMRLQNKIHDLQKHSDPILTLRNASGTTIAMSDNHFFGDPFLSHRFEQAGEYALEIRDVRYHGNRYWTYAVEVSDRPFVTNAYPMAVQRGADVSLQLVGHQLPENATTSFSVGPEAALGAQRMPLPLGEDRSNPVWVVVSDLPQEVEQPGDNDTPENAQMVVVPGMFNGRIESEADVDCFAFEAKKGEKYTFEVLARRYGSALDSNLRILDATGKRLSENDDFRESVRTYSDSRVENWTAPSDGKFVVEIRDLHLRGGDPFVYAVEVTPAEPHFELFLDTDKTLLQPGTAAPLFVRVERKNGFQGEVQLHVDGLPEGVTATAGRILAGKGQDGCIVLEAAPDAKPQLVEQIVVRGTATRGEGDQQRELSAVAQPLQEIYQPGGGRGHWPVESHFVSVGEPGDVRSMTLSTYDVVLKPGGSQKIDVTVERAEGFDKTISLDVVFQHLNRKYGNSLPEGVSVDAKNSKLRLNGKETRGHITLTAAKDARPVEKQIVPVMGNIALNFVMKSTYAAKPLSVTVTAEQEGD